MSPGKRERMNELCTRIQREQDQSELTRLLRELSELLGTKEQDLADDRTEDRMF
jgi:hypothetical protein